jgi:hypothetical protein
MMRAVICNVRYKMKKLLIILLALSSSMSNAVVSDCKNLYVGRLDLYKEIGLSRFTLVANQNDTVGSQWISMAGWGVEEKKEIVSILLSAKVSGSKIYVETSIATSSDKCGIATDTGRVLERLILQQGDY